MAQAQVYEGTLDQIVKQLIKLPNTRKYKITVTPKDPEAVEMPPKMLTFGMFPQLECLTEEDFKSAEWRGEELEL